MRSDSAVIWWGEVIRDGAVRDGGKVTKVGCER